MNHAAIRRNALVWAVCLVTPMFNIEKWVLLGVGLCTLILFIITPRLKSGHHETKLHYFYAFAMACILPYFIYFDQNTLMSAAPICLCAMLIWYIQRYAGYADFYKVKTWSILFTLVMFSDVVWQSVYGHDLLFGYENVFGWKATGPYPFVYLDTYALVFMPILWLYYRSAQLSTALFYVLELVWVLIIILSGTRSVLFQLVTTPLLVWIVLSKHRLRDLARVLSIATVGVLVAVISGLFELVYQLNSQYFDRLLKLYEALSSLDLEESDNRYELWMAFFSLLHEYPLSFLFGFGFGTLQSMNNALFNDQRILIDDFQSIWLDVAYSVGFLGLMALFFSVWAFYRKYISRVQNTAAKQAQVFLLLWFLSPFNVQHKLMDVWFDLNIVLALYFIILVSRQFSRGCTDGYISSKQWAFELPWLYGRSNAKSGPTL